MMHEYANGIDNSPVYFEREAAKNISSSTVLPYNYSDEKMIYDVIMKLSSTVGRQLRYNKMYADTIGIWLKYNYFDKISKQEKLNISISTDEEIYDNAKRIFDKLWNHDDGIRSICVFISGLSSERKRQLSIFDMGNNEEEKDEKLQELVDDLQSKYGKRVLRFANMKERK